MWFGSGAFRASTSTGGGLITSATAFVRHFSRKRAENLRKINPKVSFPEANSIARDLYDVVKQHGPLSISNTWVQAKVLPLSVKFISFGSYSVYLCAYV